MKQIQEKLMKVQSELEAPKSQFNKFGNYAYRSCEDILALLKPLLKKEGVTLVISDEIVNIGNRFYIKATATLSFDEESISVSAFAREEETKKGMDSSQITGSASSYARKYALNGLFCIDDTKDADATNTHDKEMPKKVPNLFPGKQRTNNPNPEPMTEPKFNCVTCGIEISEKVMKYSTEHYGESLCMNCQKKQNVEEVQEVEE